MNLILRLFIGFVLLSKVTLVGYYKEITNLEEFETAKKDNPFLIIKFYSTGCRPCETIAPRYEALAKQEVEIPFLSLNYLNFMGLTKTFQIKSVPRFVFLETKSNTHELINFADIETKIRNAKTKPKVSTAKSLQESLGTLHQRLKDLNQVLILNI